ncbi:MAG: HAD hydrolase-like protein [Clostridia bacterium]|nr:HAD hydrolase-like protein [Clostridia bacterium]
MSFKYILFDLDGTLSDSAPGITKSVAYALEKFGIHEKAENLGYFVGPPLYEAFRDKYGMNPENTSKAIQYFRERFEAKGILENTPYDGVEYLLRTLHSAGKKLILATSKPEKFAAEILERYGFAKYFTFIGGACMDESTRMKKDEVIEYCLTECNITDTSECIMVGDRYHDVEGAKKFNIPTVGVLYGYGTREELEDAGAIAVCETPEALCEYLLK